MLPKVKSFEDDPADRLYEVISGAICTYRMLKEGRRQIGGFYFSGDIFGLEAAEKHILTAQAITNAKVRISNKQAVNALMSRDVKLADQLLSVMARELARKQDHVLLLSRSADVPDNRVHNYPPRWNAAPSQEAAVLTAAALGSSCGEEACGLFGERFRKLEVRAVPGIRVEEQPGIR
jgi:CRP-like cAMP-binding protein